MHFKWGPLEIGGDDEGGVTVVTFKQAWITTAIVVLASGAIWLFSLTQPAAGFWQTFVSAYLPMPFMLVGFAWLTAALSWALKGFRKQ
jgi:hypothetical protein